jgi:hypothetical protein
MLYVDENEKKYIKSLYYTANINEQLAPLIYNPKTGQMQGSAQPPTWGEIKALGGEIYQIGAKRYDLNSPDGIHNLLDDGELIASLGGYGPLVSIFHGLYYFVDGVRRVAKDEFGKIKSFFLGLIQLVLALPGLKELPGLKIFGKWKDVIKNSTTLDWLATIGEPAIKNSSNISNGVKTAMTYLDKLDVVIKTKPNLTFLSRFLNIVKKFMTKIMTWIDEIIALIKSKTGLINAAKTKIAQIKGADRDKKIEAAYDMGANAVNQYLNPKAPQNVQNTKNTQIATQDTTDPRYYKPKTMPTTLNKR